MRCHIATRGLVVLSVVLSSFGVVALPAGAASAPDTIRPSALACSPELPVAGKVCTPV
jgi:hypothetical protein